MSGFEDLGLTPLRGLDDPRGEGPRAGSLRRDTSQNAFSSLLDDTVGEVQRLQKDVGDKYDSLAKGEPVDLHDIYIASGKADVAFTLMLEVRNRLVDAWQTLSRSVV